MKKFSLTLLSPLLLVVFLIAGASHATRAATVQIPFTIFQPAAGDILFEGQTYTISWQNPDFLVGKTFKTQIDYKMEAGGWITLDTNEADTCVAAPCMASFQWAIPKDGMITKGQILITIGEPGKPLSGYHYLGTSGIFSRSNTDSIIVTQPTGGETWTIGTAHEIKWRNPATLAGKSFSYTVAVQKQGNGRWYHIYQNHYAACPASGICEDGFLWTIDRALPADLYKVSINTSITAGGGSSWFTILSDGSGPVYPTPVVSNVVIEDISHDSATLTWATDIEATSRVSYGTISGQLNKRSDEGTYRTDHGIRLGEILPNTIYYYEVSGTSRDSAVAESVSGSFTTTSQPDDTGQPTVPTITNVQVNDVTSSSVRITWSTDIDATSYLSYSEYYYYPGDPLRNLSFTQSHEIKLNNLRAGTAYDFIIAGNSRSNRGATTVRGTFSTVAGSPSTKPSPITPTDVEIIKLRERIQKLELQISDLEKQTIDREVVHSEITDQTLASRLQGQILLQVDEKGEAWYVDPITRQRFYLRDGNTAYSALRAFGLGISDRDVSTIPIAVEERAIGIDSDGDGLSDKLEVAIKTDPHDMDSDNDGYEDGEEVKAGYSPTSDGKLPSSKLKDTLKGRIVLQVESHGEAWYVINGKRYYLGDGDQAYQIMRLLSLGITNSDLRKIKVGEFK